MKKIYTVLILIILISCNTQHQNQNETSKTLEKFDIETFEKNQVNGKYNLVLEDGTKIKQSIDGDFYNYKRIPVPPKMFITTKQFYKSGILRLETIYYHNRFLKSKKKYNEHGELIEYIDYDKPFKFTFEQLLELINKEKDTIDLFDKNTRITRGVVKERTLWEIVYRKTYGRREEIVVDGITGEILERSYHLHLDN